MKKVVVYFSDCMGTIFGNKGNTEDDYQNFSNLLLKIKEREQADEIIFSLISTDNKEAVSNVQKTMHPYIGQTVTYGRQYFDKGYYTDSEVVQKEFSGKAVDITEYVGELSKNYEISSVYYADDVEMYHELLFFLAEDNNWSEQLHSIIPTGNIGIAEVTQLLESNIKERFGNQK